VTEPPRSYIDFRHVLVFVEDNGLFSLDGDAWQGVELERLEDLVDVLGLEVACEDNLLDDEHPPPPSVAARVSPARVLSSAAPRGPTVGCPHCYVGFPSEAINEHMRTAHGVLPTPTPALGSPAMSTRRSSTGSSVMRGLRALVGGGGSESPREARPAERSTTSQPTTPARFVDSSIVACPVCGRSMPIEQATTHTNACLDLAEEHPDEFVGVAAEIVHPPSPADGLPTNGSRRSRARLPSIRRRTSGIPPEELVATTADTISFEREQFAELESLSSDDEAQAAADNPDGIGMVPMRSLSTTTTTTTRPPVVYEELPLYPDVHAPAAGPDLTHYSEPFASYSDAETASVASTVPLEETTAHEEGVECPVCARCFPRSTIERHVDACLGGS
jgi:hypothetical protein